MTDGDNLYLEVEIKDLGYRGGRPDGTRRIDAQRPTFYSLTEAEVILEQRFHYYNYTRTHTSLGDKPPSTLPSCQKRCIVIRPHSFQGRNIKWIL
jgi:hypothetical protein